MLNYLKELARINKFISIYLNTEAPSKFHYAKVMCVDEKNTLLCEVTPEGKYDGMILIPTEDIFRIEEDGLYQKRMLSLSCDFEIPHFECKNDDLLFSFLEYSCCLQKIVSIELLHSGEKDIIGYIEKIDDNTCKIKQIDFYGLDDGFSIVALDSITQVSCDSQEEMCILALRKNNN